jgi:hypothetical protein
MDEQAEIFEPEDSLAASLRLEEERRVFGKIDLRAPVTGEFL